MSMFQALLADGVPPAPPSFDVGHFGIGSSHANISTRQTALEPAAAGVDRPTSWSGWIIPSNQGTYQQRILGCGKTTTAGEQQYNINILSQDRSDAIYNQKLYMVINGNVGGTIFINIASSLRILKARATNFVVTYSGNESNTGLNIYINGVLDPAPTRSGAGVYAGALDD